MSVEKNATETTESAAAAGAEDTTKAVDAGKQVNGADDAHDEDLLGDVAAADKGSDDNKEAAAEDDEDDLLEGKVKEGEEDGKTAAPDDYEFTIPDGFEADAELADISKPVFKEAGLNNDQAKTLVERLGPQIITKIGEKMAAQWKETQKGWAKEAKSDPEFGGKNLEASLSQVALARDYLGPDFTAAIKLVGANNHPAILKALAKVGQALAEDTPGFGAPVVPARKPTDFYKNDQPNTQ